MTSTEKEVCKNYTSFHCEYWDYGNCWTNSRYSLLLLPHFQHEDEVGGVCE